MLGRFEAISSVVRVFVMRFTIYIVMRPGGAPTDLLEEDIERKDILR